MHVLLNQLDAYVIFAYLRSVLHGKSSKEHRKKEKKKTQREHAFNNINKVSKALTRYSCFPRGTAAFYSGQ